jgi:hypothetical protein
MLLLALALAGAAPAEWFRAVQFASKDAVLRGCADCQGEPDDACEVRAGIQMRTLDDYAQKRWPAPGRVKLLRSNADPDCAVPAKTLFAGRGPVEVLAVRMAPNPPPPALLEQVALGPPIQGWPQRAPHRPQPVPTAHPDRGSLRTSLICRPAEKGWPWPTAGADGRSTLDKANLCEWWLLSVKPDTSEADLTGVSFPLGVKPFAATDPRWAAAFDPALPLESALLESPPPLAAKPPAQPLALAPGPALGPAPDPAKQRCGDPARSRTATLDRFDQWDRQVRASPFPSLDRASFTLDAGAWSGHCQELDVLRAALEQQLGCGTALSGACASASGAP